MNDVRRFVLNMAEGSSLICHNKWHRELVMCRGLSLLHANIYPDYQVISG